MTTILTNILFTAITLDVIFLLVLPIKLTNLDRAATEGVRLNPKKLKSIKVDYDDDYVENSWEGVG